MSAPPPPDPTTTTRLFTNPIPPPTNHNSSRPQQQPQPQPHLHSHPNSFPRHLHNQPPLYTNQNQRPSNTNNNKHQIQYPVASSGRGYLPRPIIPQHQSVPSRTTTYPYQFRPSFTDHLNQTMHLVRPNSTNNFNQSLLGSTGGPTPHVIRGVPVSSNPKVAPPSSLPNSNGIKDLRERSKDDNFVTIRDRKVKLSEGSSLYSLCRSWMKNSISEENQPRYSESVKSLPKPLPAHVADANDSNSEVNKEDDKEESVEDVEMLTPKELLQGHIKRAKKVRARLREDRLQRIARYKGRLALLLPPVVEQQLKNDSSASAN